MFRVLAEIIRIEEVIFSKLSCGEGTGPSAAPCSVALGFKPDATEHGAASVPCPPLPMEVGVFSKIPFCVELIFVKSWLSFIVVWELLISLSPL